jgi:hypothetical protein
VATAGMAFIAGTSGSTSAPRGEKTGLGALITFAIFALMSLGMPLLGAFTGSSRTCAGVAEFGAGAACATGTAIACIIIPFTITGAPSGAAPCIIWPGIAPCII